MTKFMRFQKVHAFLSVAKFAAVIIHMCENE